MTVNSTDEQPQLEGCCHPSPGLLARAAAGWAKFLHSAAEREREGDDE